MAVGPWQIVIVVLLILLVFGASRLSEIGKGLGEGIRQFKKGIGEDEPPKRSRRRGRASDDEDDEDVEDDDEGEEDDEPKRLASKKRRAKQADDDVRERRHVRAKRSKRDRDSDKERS